MLWLKRGDRIPSVALIQSILNQDPQKSGSIQVDGIFGKNTYDKVVEFQKRRNIRETKGLVEPETWKQLSNLTDCQILDIVDDNFDDVMSMVHRSLMDVGSHTIMTFFLENALENLIGKIKRRVESGGKIGLLRIFGHGRAEKQNLSTGIGGRWEREGGRLIVRTGEVRGGRRVPIPYGSKGGRALSSENICESLNFMDKLRPYFAPLGSLELQGCQIARGKGGRRFVALLALKLCAPVTAAIGKNKVSSVHKALTLRVESPFFTFFPWGFDLRTWASFQEQKRL